MSTKCKSCKKFIKEGEDYCDSCRSQNYCLNCEKELDNSSIKIIQSNNDNKTSSELQFCNNKCYQDYEFKRKAKIDVRASRHTKHKFNTLCSVLDVSQADLIDTLINKTYEENYKLIERKALH